MTKQEAFVEYWNSRNASDPIHFPNSYDISLLDILTQYDETMWEDNDKFVSINKVEVGQKFKRFNKAYPDIVYTKCSNGYNHWAVDNNFFLVEIEGSEYVELVNDKG